ncbi:TRAP transporter small permease [Kiloniella litopenaei]|uniref:TRAP transporter small permease n=1 Tax=Kiloniella litopenaei TaxID=1549748 RepID=UPI0012FF2940|nr:TRAP transporter small permease [Kiloniella litopenaei]
MNFFKHFSKTIDKLTNAAGVVAAWLFFLIGFFITYEVVMRKLGMPTKWSEEFSQIAQIWCVYLGIAFALQKRSLIIVDIIGDNVNKLLRKGLDLFAIILTALFCVVATVNSFKDIGYSLKTSATTDTVLAIPMWIIQISLPIGLTFLFLQCLSEFYKTCTGTEETLSELDQAH